MQEVRLILRNPSAFLPPANPCGARASRIPAVKTLYSQAWFLQKMLRFLGARNAQDTNTAATALSHNDSPSNSANEVILELVDARPAGDMDAEHPPDTVPPGASAPTKGMDPAHAAWKVLPGSPP